jgi:hypothetical protein
VHHTLSVGEVYDKAVDLCLRNAGKIALTLGVFSLIGDALSVLTNGAQNDPLLKAMHLRLHGPLTTNMWIEWLAFASSFLIFPNVIAALYILFDRALRGEKVGLRECFSAPLRRRGNLVVASFLAGVYAAAPTTAIIFAYLAAVIVIKQPAVTVLLGLATLGVAVWLLGLLATGVAVGFARVVLDEGRVIQSLRVGIAGAFAKASRRRALGVGVPLAFVLLLGNFGGYYLGIFAFGLTGADAANVIVQSLGDVIAWSITAAVATVYYRNLTPAD